MSGTAAGICAAGRVLPRRLRRESGVLCERLSGRLMPPDDDEDVAVDEDHDQQRGEEEASVLGAEAQVE